MYALLADLIVVVHLAFIVFAVAGGLLVVRWPRLVWAHLPAAAWAGVVTLFGWICPLTPVENRLRVLAGEAAYAGDFIDRYLLPLIYPAELTRGTQMLLSLGVLLLNVGVYGWLCWRRRH